jgi:hypothetical protein
MRTPEAVAVLAITAAIALAGTGTAYARSQRDKPAVRNMVSQTRTSSVDAGAIADADRAVTDHLDDPGSAQFSDEFIATNGQNRVAVCGLVNAKNGSGGYTGRRAFYIRLDATSGKANAIDVEIADPDETMPDGFEDVCLKETTDKAAQSQLAKLIVGELFDTLKATAKDASRAAEASERAFEERQ